MINYFYDTINITSIICILTTTIGSITIINFFNNKINEFELKSEVDKNTLIEIEDKYDLESLINIAKQDSILNYDKTLQNVDITTIEQTKLNQIYENSYDSVLSILFNLPLTEKTQSLCEGLFDVVQTVISIHPEVTTAMKVIFAFSLVSNCNYLAIQMENEINSILKIIFNIPIDFTLKIILKIFKFMDYQNMLSNTFDDNTNIIDLLNDYNFKEFITFYNQKIFYYFITAFNNILHYIIANMRATHSIHFEVIKQCRLFHNIFVEMSAELYTMEKYGKFLPSIEEFEKFYIDVIQNDIFQHNNENSQNLYKIFDYFLDIYENQIYNEEKLTFVKPQHLIHYDFLKILDIKNYNKKIIKEKNKIIKKKNKIKYFFKIFLTCSLLFNIFYNMYFFD